MLINFVDWYKRHNNLDRPHKAIVVDNIDPDKRGRVKVTIDGVLLGDTSVLPWVFPLNPTGLGGGSSSSWFSVPELGSELVVTFPYGDIYSGFYVGYWQTAETHQTLFDEDYPESYGFMDSTGNHYKVNKAQGTMEIQHASGILLKFNQDGSLDLEVPEDLTETIDGDRASVVGGVLNINVTGNATVDSQGKVVVKGAQTVEIDGGSGGVIGAVTGKCKCAFTGQDHPQVSGDVKARTG